LRISTLCSKLQSRKQHSRQVYFPIYRTLPCKALQLT
jgi:hypothetical protein